MMTTSLDLDAPIDYRPSGPFEIDTRPFAAGELLAIRKGQWRTTYQRDVARALGIDDSQYAYWERGDKDVPVPWRALIREWFVHGIDIDNRPAPTWMAKSLAALVDSWRNFCPMLGYDEQAFGNWVTRGQLPVFQGVSALVRWLHEEIQPPRVDDLRTACPSRAELELSEVREIRRRLKSGERAMALAVEYGCTPTNIRSIRDGETWRWV